MERKANFFWNDLQSGDPKEKAKKWRENLRGVRSQNDMNKAVPQPPLFPIMDFDDDEFAIWEASRELSCDEVIPETENWEESAATTEMYIDDIIPETENWEESATSTEMYPDNVVPETENWEESATSTEMYPDDFIPETENWEENAPITETFL